MWLGICVVISTGEERERERERERCKSPREHMRAQRGGDTQGERESRYDQNAALKRAPTP